MPYENRTYALTATQLYFGLRFESMRVGHRPRSMGRGAHLPLDPATPARPDDPAADA